VNLNRAVAPTNSYDEKLVRRVKKSITEKKNGLLERGVSLHTVADSRRMQELTWDASTSIAVVSSINP
jgi:hypothetical protein